MAMHELTLIKMQWPEVLRRPYHLSYCCPVVACHGHRLYLKMLNQNFSAIHLYATGCWSAAELCQLNSPRTHSAGL